MESALMACLHLVQHVLTQHALCPLPCLQVPKASEWVYSLIPPESGII